MQQKNMDCLKSFFLVNCVFQIVGNLFATMTFTQKIGYNYRSVKDLLCFDSFVFVV